MADESPRQQLVDNFKEICGVDQNNMAEEYLERCEWDLEMAIQEYLNEIEGQPSVMSRERMENIANNRRQEEMRAVGGNPRPAAPIVRRQNYNQPPGWIRWAWSLITLPVRFITISSWDLLSFIYNTFLSPFFRRAVTDPVADVAQFVRDFETKYGSVHPTFYQGSYSMALSDTKRELKYLLVYLHSDLHQNTNRFCRETLCDRRFIDFINSKDMLFWGCSIRSSEGYRVSLAMRETTYPFMGLICNRDNRMVVVVRQEGLCSTDELIELLNLAVNDNDIYLQLARQEREHQQENQLLRQQQEAAFQESLRADREKEQRRLDVEREKEEEAQRLREMEEEVARKRQQFVERREQIRRSLPAEPNSNDSSAVVRVSLKFSSGARLERRFFLNDSLELLHDVAASHDDCPMKFSIINVYPRKTIRCRPSPENDEDNEEENDRSPIVTFAESGLKGAVTLLVQDDEA